MHKDDFDAFTKQAEVLCAGFNVPPTDDRIEALWRGLQAMHLGQFTRVVEVALTGGNDKQRIEKMPTTPQLWNLSRSMRARAPAKVDLPPAGDRFQVIVSKFLWLFIFRKGPFAPDVLAQLLAAKDQLIRDYRIISAEEDISDLQFGTATYQRFAKIIGCDDVRLTQADLDFIAGKERRAA